MQTSYTELHCLSNFTFLRGASHPEELVERALALSLSGLALTDECSFAGSARAHLALAELRATDSEARAFNLIHGTEIQLHDGPRLVLLAQTRTGYGNLSQLVTLARRQAAKGSYYLSMADLAAHAHWLTDTLAILIPQNRGQITISAAAVVTVPAAASLREDPAPEDAMFDSTSTHLATTLPENRNQITISAAAMSVIYATSSPSEGHASTAAVPESTESTATKPAANFLSTSSTSSNPLAADSTPSTTSLSLLAAPATGTGLDHGPDHDPLARIEQHVRWLKQLLPDRCWLACELLRGADDAAQLAALQEIAQRTGVPLVACGDVHMHVRSRKKLADVLTAVRTRTPLAAAGRMLAPNGERYLRPRYRLARIYPPELLAQTLVIAARCNFSLAELRYEYPEEIVPPGETPTSYLRRATYEQAALRYPNGIPDSTRRIVEYELALITELRYEPYFLTVYDIVRFARSQGILCQGRGSAANSAVCYCLGITEVDPARMSVLFERFISKERNEPPDIDVDFEHQRREEVMQYIYAKYGRQRAALTAALHTYRPRGALRDVGKALGLSLDQVDKLAKSFAWWDGRKIVPERLAEAGFDPANPVIAQLAELAQELIGFPRHLSQHSGGFVIARDRLDRLVPIENAAMAERTVIQWDKDDLDALGLLKIDVLALGMLSCVRRALAHLNAFYPDPRARVASTIVVATASGEPPTSNKTAHRGKGCSLTPTPLPGGEGLNDSVGEHGRSLSAANTSWDSDGQSLETLLFLATRGLSPSPPGRGVGEREQSVFLRDIAIEDELDVHLCRESEIIPFDYRQAQTLLPPHAADPSQTPSTGSSKAVRLQDIPSEDKQVYAMLCRGDSLGVFQVESRAQMNMLPRLRPRCFYDLVIETAIVRPGPIQGGMVHPYLKRRQGIEDVTYPSPAVRAVLERTLGVSIFQEQVMQLAVVAAGFTPGEADRLRRAMAAWKRKGGIGPFRDKLINGMLAHGYTAEYAEQIYRQIQGFGEYGFPESHAASFAYLVYVSSWLKCHEPAAFCAALLDSQPLGFYAPAQIVRDAMNHGVEVRTIDVTASDWNCRLEPVLESTPANSSRAGLAQAAQSSQPTQSMQPAQPTQPMRPAVRLGLELINGFNQAAAERIVAARAQAPFADVADLTLRAQLNRGEIARLAAADALASLAGHRRDALWASLGLEPDAPRVTPLIARAQARTIRSATDTGKPSMRTKRSLTPTPLPEGEGFNDAADENTTHDAPGTIASTTRDERVDLLAPTEGENIVADYEYTALTLRRHPLALLRNRFEQMRLATALQVSNARHRQTVRTTGIVTCRQRPATASGVTFVTLEDETGVLNVVVWRATADKYRRELLGATLLTVYGHVERVSTAGTPVIHLIAARLVDHSALLGGLTVRSHNFH